MPGCELVSDRATHGCAEAAWVHVCAGSDTPIANGGVWPNELSACSDWVKAATPKRATCRPPRPCTCPPDTVTRPASTSVPSGRMAPATVFARNSSVLSGGTRDRPPAAIEPRPLAG